VKLCKEWDKLYVKHVKGAYGEMAEYHAKCMKPLMDLINSNNNFHKLENMIKNK